MRLKPSGSSYVVRGIPGRVTALAGREWGITDLAAFAALDPTTRTRADLARIVGDTKALAAHPLDGIFLRLTVAANLGGHLLNPTPEGCAHFVAASEISLFSPHAPVLIGVENAESFLKFERCSAHFPDLDIRHAALIWRWNWGGKWQQWLQGLGGTFAWFPDYDPAGLAIFSHQILSCRPEARLLIPKGLDRLLEHGNRELFLRQEQVIQGIVDSPDDPFIKHRTTQGQVDIGTRFVGAFGA